MLLFCYKHFGSTMESMGSKIVIFINKELWFSQTVYLNTFCITEAYSGLGSYSRLIFLVCLFWVLQYLGLLVREWDLIIWQLRILHD